MEITLEKIELVKDRTGVTYKEAKEALEAAEGNVVDAIINIEESIDGKEKSKVTDYASVVIERVKELVKKGNVSRIVVKKDEELILNLPLNVGIIGTVMAPIAMLAGIVAAFGTKCVIEVIKDDGTIIDVSEMASDAAAVAVEKGSELADEIKVRSSEIYEVVREKSTVAYEAVKDKAYDVMNKADYSDDACCCCEEENCEDCELAEDIEEVVEDVVEEIAEVIEEAAEEITEDK